MIIATIQARTGSKRFPNKILKPIFQELNSIEIMIDKLKGCPGIDQLVILTTENPNDNIFDKYSEEKNVIVFHGDEEFPMKRMNDFIKSYCKRINESYDIIDLTSDCVLLDTIMLCNMLNNYYRYEYYSNTVTRGFPDGYDIQIYKAELITELYPLIENKNHLTHTGWNILNYSDKFKYCVDIGNYSASEFLFHPDWGLTLDTIEDYEVLRKIFQHFKKINFTVYEVIKYLESNPDILNINKNINRNIPGV